VAAGLPGRCSRLQERKFANKHRQIDDENTENNGCLVVPVKNQSNKTKSRER